MKISHRVPAISRPHGDVVDDSYQSEVDRNMERIEREYREAQKRLQAAERRAVRVRSESVSRAKRRAHDARIADAEAVVELRRIELEKYERLMKSSAASSKHWGRKSEPRPVPFVHGSLL